LERNSRRFGTRNFVFNKIDKNDFIIYRFINAGLRICQAMDLPDNFTSFGHSVCPGLWSVDGLLLVHQHLVLCAPDQTLPHTNDGCGTGRKLESTFDV